VTFKATPRLTPTVPRTVQRVVVDPYTTEWQDWVDSTVGLNPRLGLPTLAATDLDWREFSERLSQFVPDTPYHEEFDDWRDWAAALRSSLLL
jgi:hypothetical protein